jgi:hypothetical protein
MFLRAKCVKGFLKVIISYVSIYTILAIKFINKVYN